MSLDGALAGTGAGGTVGRVMRIRAGLSGAVAAAALLAPGAAVAAGTVVPARGATRASLVHAFVVQDGSSAGIRGVYVSRSRPPLGVVCQRTPDAGTVRFLFRSSGRSWRFAFSTTGRRRGGALAQQLERACG